MSSKKHTHKASYYNDIALRLAHKLLGITHLHYGYFDSGLKKDLANLPKAQEKYVANLLTFIPKGVKRIFDVGSGSGGVAEKLVKKRFSVTCLAPDPYLIQKTLENTGGKVDTITDLYENVTHIPPESFDLILMSESCQYIKVREGWEQHRKFLRPGGYVLLSDFFKIRELDQPYLSKSGHPLDEFIAEGERQGFKLLKKSDITKFVAPTMDIYQGIITDKVFPVLDAISEFVSRRYPRLHRMLKPIVGPKMERLVKKYSKQDSETFKKYKGYFILLFQKKAE